MRAREPYKHYTNKKEKNKITRMHLTLWAPFDTLDKAKQRLASYMIASILNYNRRYRKESKARELCS